MTHTRSRFRLGGHSHGKGRYIHSVKTPRKRNHDDRALPPPPPPSVAHATSLTPGVTPDGQGTEMACRRSALIFADLPICRFAATRRRPAVPWFDAARGSPHSESTMRRAAVERNTKETQIRVAVNLDGSGTRMIDTPVPFLSHMIEAVARHGLFDLEVDAKGDIDVDAHHTVEDVGIVLGSAFKQALGDRQGITRFGDATIPMDETLVTAAVDLSGRAALVYLADMLKGRWIGTFDAELAREFFGGFVSTALCNLHLEVRYGENAHHMVEASFKAFARALRVAVAIDPRVQGVPSTKGTLTT